MPKSVLPNIYFSRFYAFEDDSAQTASPSYPIVARTGKFCFGYASPNDMDGSSNHQHPLLLLQNYSHTRDAMQFGNHNASAMNCPRIHFVGGMVDKYGAEDSTVVISYGINDCLSRIIEVKKADIAKLLWDPH